MTTPDRPAALHDVDPSRIVDLDVRDDLRAGREPFGRIMQARGDLATDGVLRLRAIFEPRPLFGVMARAGFRHWAEQLGPQDWRIWFYRPREAGESTPASEAPTDDPSAPSADAPASEMVSSEPSDFVVLDVRGMEPPEPLTATLAQLEALPVGHTLIQINQRRPHFLFPELERRGFRSTVRESEGVVRVFIRHR